MVKIWFELDKFFCRIILQQQFGCDLDLNLSKITVFMLIIARPKIGAIIMIWGFKFSMKPVRYNAQGEDNPV